jgi:signal transduction histidine kinase
MPDTTAADAQEIIGELQRKLNELTAQQAATANILGVIANSPTDVSSVLNTIVESACKLCDAVDALVLLKNGDKLSNGAHYGPIPYSLGKWTINRNWVAGCSVIDQVPVHVVDMFSAEGDEFPDTRERARRSGTRTYLSIPLLREGKSIGAILLRRTEVHAFNDKQIALLQSFADQAVIAIENARLFNETKEALERQTTTADVLKVIASSPSNIQPVFDVIAERANKLISGYATTVLRIVGDMIDLAAFTPVSEEADAILQAGFPVPIAGNPQFEMIRRGELGEIVDTESEIYAQLPIRNIARARGYRSRLLVPLKNDSGAIGAISVSRVEPGSFADQDVQLLQTFADQAVIAISNVELFQQVQAKTHDLEESLQQQTATAEVLQIISSSPSDLAPVFENVLGNATRVCGAEFGSMNLVEDDSVRQAALYNAPVAFAAVRTNRFYRPHPQSSLGIAIHTKQAVHVADLRTTVAYREHWPSTVELVELGGARTVVVVPLLREDEVIGAITIFRQEVRPFEDKQIELVRTFARQAVIAIENARLLKELRQRTSDLSNSLDDLRTAQDRLIQTEKLASLGQLTAGIAHEIKNPLNFVNNFSALSAELTDELNDLLKSADLAGDKRKEVDELTALLKDNLGKVVQHGKRADSIVKNMLLHSREGSGEHRSADINALVEESLNLAYHGARAEKSGFNITLTSELDPDAGKVELYPQEIIRVLLNLISNGFYAATKRKSEAGDEAFEPVLSAATKNLGNTVEIRIRDNGTGIPPEVKEKMFNPFFTTKPAGEGTGLGLSMSHDIIVKQHGGRIDVETEPGAFTEFIITLPRNPAGQILPGGKN